jgi:Rap guanine nucleotide exchange factor 2
MFTTSLGTRFTNLFNKCSTCPPPHHQVTRILLLWVNNHFTDFELDSEMMELLDRFESKLEAAKMHGQLRMLNFACAAKARPR